MFSQASRSLYGLGHITRVESRCTLSGISRSSLQPWLVEVGITCQVSRRRNDAAVRLGVSKRRIGAASATKAFVESCSNTDSRIASYPVTSSLAIGVWSAGYGCVHRLMQSLAHKWLSTQAKLCMYVRMYVCMYVCLYIYIYIYS